MNFLHNMILKKIIIIFLMTATFALLFEIQTSLIHIFILSFVVASVTTLLGHVVLGSRETVIVHLYALFVFTLIMVIVNVYTFALLGRGMNNQTTVFYFALSLTIFMTVYDFYNPKKKNSLS